MYIFLIIGLLICLIPLIFGIILTVKKNKFTTIPAYVLDTQGGLCPSNTYCYLTINYTFNGQNYTTPYSAQMSRAISVNDRIEIQVDDDGFLRYPDETREYPKRHEGSILILMSFFLSFLVLFCYAKIVIK